MRRQIINNIEDIYPLSPAQRGILFHSLDEAGDKKYFFQVIFTLSGPLNLDVFRQAWQRLIDQHAILRTAFVWKNLEQPLQVVQRQTSLTMEVCDDTPDSPVAWEQYRAEFLRRDRDRGLALSRPPLMRLTALRTPQGLYSIVWSFHHLVADAWSQSLLLVELFQQYDALLSGGAVSQRAPASFRSYVEWLQKRSPSVISNEEAFWRETFRDFDAPATLRVRSAHGSDLGSSLMHQEARIEMSVEESDSLRVFARDRRTTLNTLIQTAWAVLIAKCSGSDDVVFGVTVATRPPELPGSASIIGPLINTVPQRIKIRAEETAEQLLQRAQQAGLDLFEHSSASLTSIRQWAGVAGSSALFETIIVFENAPFDSAVAQRITSLCESIESVEPTNYALALKVAPGRCLTFTLIYDNARFSHVFAERTLGLTRHLLKQICSVADIRVADLGLVSNDRMREQVSETFSAGSVGRTASDLFAVAAARDPNAIALETSAEKISYWELDERATSLASQLRASGIRAEIPVAVCLPRGLRQVIAALAIWKAGGVYAPVETDLPQERFFHQLKNMRPGLILCCDAGAERFASAGRVMVVDKVGKALAGVETGGDEEAINHPASGAYIIHTSGSTGRPKGVVVSHSGFEGLIRAQVELLEAGPGARVLQFASPSFDASIFEIALGIFSGATLVQAEEGEVLLGNALLEFLERSAITHAVMPPSLLATLPDAELPDLRVLIVAGEACLPEVVRHWGKGRRLFNAYGPTEATIWSTVAELTPSDPITIGRPISGVQAHIVDLHDQPLPIGILGELLLGGPSIARGYLDAPDLTAERFIPDSFSSSPGGRLYRTGDLACYTEQSELDFCGRIDQQIKLRGYRIELDEIVAVLSENAEVSAAAVVVVPEGNSKSLVAFVVSALGANVDAAALRLWATTKLPDYSVPARIIVLAQMPLTHTGKIDRAGLIERAKRGAGANAESTAPTTPMELLLSRFWGEITGLDQVDVNADLFDQSGDSLRLMSLIGRIGQDLGVTIPLSEVFDSPNIAALVNYVLQHSASIEALERTTQELLKRARAQST